MTADRILDAEEVVKLLPTQAALIRLGKSHEALREQLHATQTERDDAQERLRGYVHTKTLLAAAETERDQERRNSDAAVALLATAEARIVAAEARVAALTQALRALTECPSCGEPTHAPNDECWYIDLSTCAYFQERRQGDGSRSICSFGCESEPECQTCSPSEGWPLVRARVVLAENRTETT